MKKLLPIYFLKRNLLLTCFLLISVQSAFATRLYVNSASTNIFASGLSWADACPRLEVILSKAVSGDEIWVASGTYQPYGGNYYQMVKGVAIYGGFIGTETLLNQRSFKNNRTILRGNSNSVVQNTFTAADPLDNTSILDGFTIQDGSSNLYGGGISNVFASPTLRNLIIKNNISAAYGGGIACQSSSPLIENVTIDQNTADYLGGGISIEAASAPILKNVVITNNESKFGIGGGIDLYQSTITLDGVVIALNKSSVAGGGINNESESAALSLNNVVFYKNTSADGGGFSGFMSDAKFTNVTFSQNIASGTGGAINYTEGGSGKKPAIINSIFWGNTAAISPDIEASLLSINYSFTQTDFTAGATGNITGTMSPFINENLPTGTDGIWLTADDGLQLNVSSTARNSGSNSASNSLSTDITKNLRVFATTVDMGAYEAQPSNIAQLTALSVSIGTLYPAFDPSITTYTIKVPYQTPSITATANFSAATAKIKGTDHVLTALTSGIPSGDNNLALGANTIEVQVTAPNGTTIKTYTLTVLNEKLPQIVVLDPIGNRSYNNVVYPTATGGGSGNPITYTSSNTAIAKIQNDPDFGDYITFISIGTVTITASQVGDATYAAGSASETITVNKAIPSIRFNALSTKAVNDAWSFYTGSPRTYTGSNQVYYTSSDPAVITMSGINYQIRGVGSAIITAHLDGDANYEAAVPVSQTQVIVAAAQTINFATLADKTYGDAAFNLTATGGGSGNAVTYLSSNTAVATIDGNTVTILAQGTATITASQAGNTNYTAATDVQQELKVNKAPLTYTATPVAVPFGFAFPTLTGTVTGLVNNESLAIAATGTASFTTTASNGSPVGSYAITGSGLTATNNYTLVQATGNATALTINDNYPILTTTNPATAITTTMATLKGNVSSDGGYIVTEKGAVYGASLNPVIETATKVTNGDGLGAISVDITALTPGTTYHFRTYAINSYGTAYGADVTFTTPFEVPSTQASDVVASGTSTTSKIINWTNGNGARRMVFVSAIITGYPTVVNGTNYTANLSFSSGSSSSVAGSTSGTWKCVYNGTGSSPITVTNLTSNNDYRIMVLEYNGTGSAIVYNTVTTATNNPINFSMPVAAPTVAPAVSGLSATAMSADFAVVTNATGYQYDISTTSNFSTFLPAYNNIVITGTRILVNGLLPSTTYYLRLRSVNAFDLASTNSPTLTFITLAEPRFEATYDFVSVAAGTLTSKTDPTPVPVPVADGLTFSAIKYAGTSTTSATTSQFGFANWPTAAALSATVYDEVTITPATGYQLTLGAFTFSVTRNSTGPTKYLVRSSVDGYASNLPASSAVSNPAVSGDVFTITGTSKLTASTITPGSDFTNLTGPITFRIYAYTASNTTSGTFTIDDVKFTGTLTGPPANAITYPKTGAVTTSTIELISNLDKTGTTYYVVIPTGGAAPVTFAQILAGQDGNGDAAKAGSFAITPSIATTTSISGLIAATAYKIYVVSKDASATPIVQTTFTTLTATTANKAAATITLSDLTATYDGAAKSATVTTNPTNLTGVTVTYDGSTTAPTAAGSYAVVAKLTNNDYTATDATGTLEISKATATLTLSDLTATYDGTAKAATVTTNPAGLSSISITYDGSATAPTTVGTYALVATLNNTNYTGTATGSLIIGKANQAITFATFANKNINNVDFEPGASVNTGLALTYTSSNTNVATVYQDLLDGNKWKIHILAEGTADITAVQAGNSNYNSQSLTRTLTIAPVTLPVGLISYTAKIEGNRARLDWATATEQNNNRFEIERSTDGIVFTKIGTVKGSGTTTQKNTYSFYDYNPANGTNYYRLKQYDYNDKMTMLGDKALSFNLSSSVSVKAFPNPTTEAVSLAFKNYNGSEVKVVISDIMGRTIYSETMRLVAGSDSYRLNLRNKLLPGQYVINVTGTGLGTTIKLIAL